MEFQHLFRSIQKRWWVIIICVIVALNLSLFNSYYLTEPRYEASALFIVSPNIDNIESDKDFVDSLEALDKRSIIATYAEVINSRQVFNAAQEHYENYRDQGMLPATYEVVYAHAFSPTRQDPVQDGSQVASFPLNQLQRRDKPL